MTLDEQFVKAQADSQLLSEKPDNQTLLKIYSLFKQGTVGDSPEEGPSNPFDIVGRAKHEAWKSLNGTTSDDAKEKYIALVESLKD